MRANSHPDGERRGLAQVLAEIELDAVDRDVAMRPRRLAEKPCHVEDEGVPGGRRHPATGSTGSSVDLGRRDGLGLVAHVEAVDPALDLAEDAGDLRLEPEKHVGRVLVGPAPRVGGVGVGVGDDPAALDLGGLGQALLIDQMGRLLAGAGDDPLGLLVCPFQDPLALGVDPAGGLDLLGDRRAGARR